MTEFLDLSLLTNKQKKVIQELYQTFLDNNDMPSKTLVANVSVGQSNKTAFTAKNAEKNISETFERRTSKKTSIDELQEYLFSTRDTEGDCYLDLDLKKYPNAYVDDSDMTIYNRKTREYIADFTYNDFVPCCMHLPESVMDELEQQVSYSTGDNCSRWSDIYKEKEHYPESLLGYHTLENGFTFYGMYGTMDGSFSVFFILYLDEYGELQGYIPREGNQFSHETNEAWGWECSLFSSDDEREEFEETLYEKMNNHTYFDYESMKEDILKNISVNN